MSSISPFIGRKFELEALNSMIQSEKPTVGVVFGRRRIGKSELVKKALEEKPYFIFEGLEKGTQRAQIDNFLFQLAIQADRKNSYPKVGSWKEALFLLYEELEKNPQHLIFDEFQWMANYRQDLIVELKMVWEQYFTRIPGLTLILCGSIASFMIKKVIKSNALYGRIDLQLHLKAFTVVETEALLQGKGKNEVVEAQLFTGGVPKYLDIIRAKSSVITAMQQEGFSDSGYFFNEYDKIFTSHFGKKQYYEKVILTLAEHPYGMLRKDIIAQAEVGKGGQISTLLYNLEKAGFIASAGPFDKPYNSKLKKYYLSDMYLRFYFAFIRPNIKKIQEGAAQNVFLGQMQSGFFFNWLGRSFELFCLQHAYIFPKIIGFSGVEYESGPYFVSSRKKGGGVQADLVFSRADNVLTVCEMKYARGPVGVEILEEMERKTARLQAMFPRKTIQNILVTLNGATQTLYHTAYFYRVVSVEDFFLGA